MTKHTLKSHHSVHNLNPEQKQASTCAMGHNLVIASAGTGKTSTIVARIAHLLHNNIPPEKILLLTFTNKASIEMIDRLDEFFSQAITSQIQSGTFHSVSYKLLRELNSDIKLKTPRELKVLFKSVYQDKRVGRGGAYDSSYLYDMYSLYLNANKGEEFGEWIASRQEDQEIHCDMYEQAVKEFDKLKNKYNYVSFDDLLIKMLDQQKNPKTKLYFEEVLVDEYQDTNPLQNRLMQSFVGKSLFCVGDYDQSIYGFNGSDISIISSFDKTYLDAKIFNLSKNYRSSKSILALANKVINNNERIYAKKLEVMRDGKDSPPKLLAFHELYEQYGYIAEHIKQSFCSYDDIAIIYRNNASADGIEANLKMQGIASKRKDSSSFFDIKEIKLVLDVIYLLSNPDDVMSFISLMENANNIGRAKSSDVYEALAKLGGGDCIHGLISPNMDISDPYTKSEYVSASLFDDIGYGSSFDNVPKTFANHPILNSSIIKDDGAMYLYKMSEMFQKAQGVNNVLDLVETITNCDFYQNILSSLVAKRSKSKDGKIDEELKKSVVSSIETRLQTFRSLAQGYFSVEKFINNIILNTGNLSDGEGVNLLSIHASKGLEFKNVYIVDLMEGRFPNTSLMAKGGSLEEERRLFYVAVTRAKDNLFLSYVKYDKAKKQDFTPSRFLLEAGLIEPSEMQEIQLD